MELFKLFGSVFLKDEEARKGLDEIDKKGEKADSRLMSITNVAGKVALGFAAIGAAAVVAIGTQAFNAADELHKGLNNVQASTGATNEEMSGLRETMLNIYKNNFGESFEDIGKSLSEVKQISGETGKSLESMTTNALMLRDTFEYEVNESTRSATALMKNFGITGDAAFNLIAQATQNGANKNDDLLDTFNEYSVQFKSLGFSAEQFANILVDGAKNGAFSIDKVGDAIKEFNIRAKDGSDTSSKAFQALGFDAKKISSEFAAGGASAQAAFQKTVKAIQSVNDPLKKNEIGVALFGTQFEDLEAKGIMAFGNIGNSVNLAKNALAGINNVKYNSFSEAMTGIGRQVQVGFLIPLGEKALPLLNSFATWLNGNMPVIQSMFGTAFNAISSVINYFTNNVFAKLQEKFQQNSGTIIPAVINIINILTTSVFPALGKIIESLTTNVLPIYADYFMSLYQKVMPPVIKIFEYITSTVVPMLAASFQEWIPTIVSILTGLKDIALVVVDAITKAFETAWPYIKGIVTAAVGMITDVVGGLLEVLKGVINFIAGVFTGDWERAWNGIKSIFEGIWNTFDGIIRGGANLIIGVVNGMISGINKISFNFPEWIPGIGGKSFGVHVPEISYLAKGTDNFPQDGWAIVGEEGPELLKLNKGSQVIPNGKTNEILSSQNKIQITIPVNLDGKQIAKITTPYIDKELYNRQSRLGVV